MDMLLGFWRLLDVCLTFKDVAFDVNARGQTKNILAAWMQNTWSAQPRAYHLRSAQQA